MTFESSFANFDENMEGFNADCRKSRRGLYLQVDISFQYFSFLIYNISYIL